MGNISKKDAEDYLREMYKREPTEEEVQKYYNYMNKD